MTKHTEGNGKTVIDTLLQGDQTKEEVKFAGGLVTLRNSIVKAKKEASSNAARILSEINKYLKFTALFKKT